MLLVLQVCSAKLHSTLYSQAFLDSVAVQMNEDIKGVRYSKLRSLLLGLTVAAQEAKAIVEDP